MDDQIPESLTNFSQREILCVLTDISKKGNFRNKNNVNKPNSMFGQAVEHFTHQKSTVRERYYVHSLWKESMKENAPSNEEEFNQYKKHKRDRYYRKRKKDLKKAAEELNCQAELQLLLSASNNKQDGILANRQNKDESKSNTLNAGISSNLNNSGNIQQVSCGTNDDENLLDQKRKVDSPHKSAGFLKKMRQKVTRRIHGVSCFQVELEDSDDLDNLSVGTHLSHPSQSNIPTAPPVDIMENEQISELHIESQDEKLQELINEYNTRIMSFPSFTCPICLRVMYKNHTSVRTFTFGPTVIQELLKIQCNTFQNGESIVMCRRCCDIFKRNKVPSQAYFNNMLDQAPPAEIQNLNSVEARLISQIKPFMKVFHLSRGQGQLALRGSCVHFPQSVEYVAETLPLAPNTADIVIVNETLENTKTNSNFEVRPQILYAALRKLKEINPLYSNIQIQHFSDEELNIPEIPAVPAQEIGAAPCNPNTGYKHIGKSDISILRASFNQLSVNEIHRQCLAFCAAAFSFAAIQTPDTWTSAEMDAIVENGQAVYNSIVPKRDTSLSLVQINIPIQCFPGMEVEVNVCETALTGFLNKVPGPQLYRLKQALADYITGDYTMAVVSVNMFHMALIKVDEYIYLYDSFSRGPSGKKANKGMSCTMKVPVDQASEFLSEHIHRNCQPANPYKGDMPKEKKQEFVFAITKIIATVKEDNLEDTPSKQTSQPASQQQGLASPRYHRISETCDILRASFHQGSMHIFPNSGNQCACMCASALAHSQLVAVREWTTSYVNDILRHGDTYYGQVLPARDEFLDPHAIGGEISCEGRQNVSIAIEEDEFAHYSGFLDCALENNEQHLSLSDCLRRFVESERNAAIFTSRDYCLALMKEDGYLYIFDSHARNEVGLRAENGTACVLRFFSPTAHIQAAAHLHTLFQPTCQVGPIRDLGHKANYGFTITVVNCMVLPPSRNNSDEPEPEEIQAEQNKQNARKTIFQDAPTHHHSIMLDCVVRDDQPDLPQMKHVFECLKKDKPIIPEVNLQRPQGRPLYDGAERRLEELSFIKAFPYGHFGYNEERKVPITPLDYFQQRVMSQNKEFQTTDYLFYALSRVEAHTIQQKINVCGMMVANDGQVQDGEISVPGLENIHLVMGSVRGSGSYWKKYTGDVLAMIEQLGVPTFFLTISYDDLNSLDALTALWKAKYGKDAELPSRPQDIPYEERRDLLNEHPIAAARHFNHRQNVILDLLLKHGEEIFGRKVIDYTYRIEFQGRGSPHLHALLWLENVPDWNTPEGIQFMERNVSCSLNVDYMDLVTRYQHHSHRATCFKNHNQCRFSFPRRPSDKTKILDEEEISRSHGRFVELKRERNETMINNYHPKLLQLLRCNMDIQAVTGTRAIAFYVGKYMSKGEPTYLRDEIRQIVNSFKGDTRGAYYRKMQQICTSIIKHREISAQECCFRLMHLPLRRSSRVAVWVPATLPSKRIRMVRRETLMTDEPKYGLNIIERYMERPDSLENLSLFEFAAWYKPKSNKNREDPDEDLIDGDMDLEDEINPTKLRTIKLKNNKGLMVKRERHAILKYPRFKPLDATDEYLYSMILLYCPMRSETIISDFNSMREAFDTLKHRFRTHEDDRIINPGEAEKITEILELLESRPEDPVDEIANDDYNGVDNLFHEDDEPLQEQEVFANPLPNEEDISIDLRAETLTKEQREVFEKVRDQIVNKGPPLRQFVHGCGGTGKSHLISVLTKLITTLCDGGHRALIKAAPTGVASRNIGGITIHKAFSLGVETGRIAQYYKLGDKLLHERRMLFKDVVFILIDEASMISYEVLRTIHLRLTEIFGNNFPFGNINIILFADLLQLPPCMGRQIFEQPKYLNHELHLWRLFGYTELQTVMRQKERDHFFDFIQRLRIGTVERTDIEFLRQFIIDPMSPNYDEVLRRSRESLHLYPTVAQTEKYNESRIKEMEEAGIRIYQIDAYDTYASGLQFGQEIPEKYVNKDVRKCAGIPKSLTLGVGAKIMLKYNSDPLGGLCNGSIGVVRKFNWTALRRDQLKTGDLPEDVLVDFEGFIDPKHFCGLQSFERCVSVKPKTFQFDGKFKKKVHRKQVPLVLCFSTTIHKAQGLTLDSATIYMGKKIFASAQLYVAVSRLRNVGGLMITELEEKRLLPNKKGGSPCNEKALREVTRLELLSYLDVPEEDIENFEELITWRVQYVNCTVCREYKCNCICSKEKVGNKNKE